MPRRKTSSNENKIKKGRGQGHGQDYVPFLYTREVPSLGKSFRIKGWKTGRVHHFLSTLESNYFYVLEWSPKVIDIREQYPLPIDATLKIAERLSIKHPYIPKTSEPSVFTTDFLIDIEIDGQRKLIARTIKYSNDLNNLRTMEKFEIERTYWKECGVDWGIVTELEVPKALAKNVEWLHSARYPEDIPGMDPMQITVLERELFNEFAAKPNRALAHCCMEIDGKIGLSGGTSLWAVRHFIATRQWEVDMMTRIEPRQPLRVRRAVLANTQMRCAQ